MAESIDELQIDIKVKDNNSAKQIDAITLAVNNLTAALSGLNKFSNVLDKLSKIKLPDVSSGLTSGLEDITSPEMIETDIDKILKGEDLQILTEDIVDPSAESSVERFHSKLAELKEKVSTLTSQISELNPQMEQLQETATQTGFAFEDMGNEINDAGKGAKDSAENAKKGASGWSKFTKSIGRIAMYRAIRSVLKGITDASKQGLENIRGENKALDESMNKISLAGTSLKNSFGAILAPIIQSVEPLITKLADGIARIVNRFTEAKAVMSGMSTYTKILTSDMTEYEKQVKKATGSLLEFDTFTTLNSKDTYTGVTTEKTTMSPEEAEKYNSIAEKYNSIIQHVTEALQEVFGLIADIIKLFDELDISAGDILDGIVLQVKGAIQIIRGLIKLLMGDLEGAGIDLTNGFKNMLKGILKLILGAINVVIDAINFLFITLNPLKWILDLVGVDTSWAKIPHIPTDWTNFANGGSYQTADLFYANENGQTELIASSNSGGGAVMNMEQLRSAIYEGMVMAMSESGTSEWAVNLDGNKVGTFVAGNVGFRNEANRRNTGLNWR